MNEIQNIKRLLLPAIKGIPIILGVMLIFSLIASRVLIYRNPVYESTAKLKLDDKTSGFSSSNLFKDFDLFTSSKKILTEKEVIKSHVLIIKALQKLDFNISYYRIGKIKKKEIYHENPFIVEHLLLNKQIIDQELFVEVIDDNNFVLSISDDLAPISASFGKAVSFDFGELTLHKNLSFLKTKDEYKLADNYSFIIHSEEGLNQLISQHLDVMELDEDVSIIRISYKSEVPAKAKLFVNALATTYIEDYINVKSEAAKRTVEFIDKQLQIVNTELSNAELELQIFKKENKVVNTLQETETGLREISQTRVLLNNLKVKEVALDSLNSYINKGNKDFIKLAPQFTFGDLLFTELIKRMKDFQNEKEDLLRIYTPNHEKVISVTRKIDDVIYYIKESISNSRKDVNIRKTKLEKLFDNSLTAFDDLPEREREHVILEREFGLTQDIYKFLMEKRTEASIAAAATIAFHRILAFGVLPKKPVSPHSNFLLIISGFLGLITALVFIYARDLIIGRIKTRIDVELNCSIPIKGVLPHQSKKQIRINDDSDFNTLVQSLLLSDLIKKNTTLAINSAVRKEGKSFVAAGLSQSFALLGWSVLLIDGNLHSPSPERFINDETDNRLEQIVFDLVLQKTGSLFILSSLELSKKTKSILTSHYFENVLKQFKSHFDLVIIDTPASAIDPDGIGFMKMADSVCYLMRSNFTKRQYLMNPDFIQKEYEIDNMFLLLNDSHKAVNFNGIYTGSKYSYKANYKGPLGKIKHYLSYYL